MIERKKKSKNIKRKEKKNFDLPKNIANCK